MSWKSIQVLLVVLILMYMYRNNLEKLMNKEVLFIAMGILFLYILYKTYFREHFDNEVQDGETNQKIDLTDLEILNHVKNIVSNINNKPILTAIFTAINKEINLQKKYELISIYDLTVANPEIISKIVAKSPSKVLELVYLLDDETHNNTVTNAELLRKINDLENIIKQGPNNKNPSNGDMKYSQLDPKTYQLPVQKEDDDWDTTGYVLMDPSVWRPRIEQSINRYQEGECPVCPSFTQGYPTNLLDFDKSRYVLPADNISIDYIKQLNNPKKY